MDDQPSLPIVEPCVETLRSEIAQKMSLAFVRYSQVWEDAQLLRQGLQIDPTDDVISIMSSGDNALDLILAGARSVTAIDMSPAQVALFELKIEAIRHLEYEQFVQFWGARDDEQRVETYTSSLRAHLTQNAAAFWDTHHDALANGPIHCGKLEHYIGGFAKTHLPELWDAELGSRLLSATTLDEQHQLLEKHAWTTEFESTFRWYFGREMMEKTGRDPQQFAYVKDGDVGLYFYKRFQWVCQNTLLRTNFYLQSFLFGYFSSLEHAPSYLTRRGFERLKYEGLLDRVTLVCDELERYLEQHPGHFSKANLSDIFEYMSPEAARLMFKRLGELMRPGGRIAYWNLLVPRMPDGDALDVLTPHPNLSGVLHARDRSWFYRDFWIDEVTR